MTNETETTTTSDERVVIVPELSVTATYLRDVKAATEALEAVLPMVEDAVNLAGHVLLDRVKAWEDDHGCDPGAFAEAFDAGTGWGKLYDLLIRLNGLGTIYPDEPCVKTWSGGAAPSWYVDFKLDELERMNRRLESPNLADAPATTRRQDMEWSTITLVTELAELGVAGMYDERERLIAQRARQHETGTHV